VYEGERDVEPALHAAREAAHDAVRGVGEAEALEQLVDTAVELGPADALEAPAEAQVLARGGLAVGAAALGDNAYQPPDRGGLGAHVVAGDARAARVGTGKRGGDPDRGRLAGAVRAEQAEHAALLDRERESVEREHVSRVVLDEALCLDCICCHCWTPHEIVGMLF
jgi:hypothetical protein